MATGAKATARQVEDAPDSCKGVRNALVTQTIPDWVPSLPMRRRSYDDELYSSSYNAQPSEPTGAPSGDFQHNARLWLLCLPSLLLLLDFGGG